jgi:predicted nucleic-acid-binding Zn-ribbon protein
MEDGCVKCGSDSVSEGEVRMTGGGLSRFFDVQNNVFETVSCDECGYTEFYRKDRDKAGEVLDFFLGG